MAPLLNAARAISMEAVGSDEHNGKMGIAAVDFF